MSFGAEFAEPLRGVVQRLWPFAEGEAHLAGAITGITVETGAGDAGYADFLDEIFCERYIIVEAEGRDVGHDVVRSPWAEAFEACCSQRRYEVVAANAVSLGEFGVIL